MKTITLLAALLLTACMGLTMPASIKQENSTFDGSTAYRMQPGFVFDSNGNYPFQIGAHWSNRTPEIVMLRAMVRGRIIPLHNIGGLQFNIDGDIVKLNAPKTTTGVDIDRTNGVLYTDSHKDYTASRTLLERITQATSVKAKLVTNSGYLEGDLSIERSGAAMGGLRELAKKISNTK